MFFSLRSTGQKHRAQSLVRINEKSHGVVVETMENAVGGVINGVGLRIVPFRQGAMTSVESKKLLMEGPSLMMRVS